MKRFQVTKYTGGVHCKDPSNETFYIETNTIGESLFKCGFFIPNFHQYDNYESFLKQQGVNNESEWVKQCHKLLNKIPVDIYEIDKGRLIKVFGIEHE